MRSLSLLTVEKTRLSLAPAASIFISLVVELSIVSCAFAPANLTKSPVPSTSNLNVGLVVPIPTLPDESMTDTTPEAPVSN